MAKTVELEFKEDDKFLGGLRQMWFELKNEDGSRHAEVSAGAGLGNPFMFINVEVDGETRRLHVNMAEALRPMLEELLNG